MMITKMIAPTVFAMSGCVTNALPPTTPPARQRRPRAEHQHENARHVVSERFDLLRMCQRRLNHEPDSRPRQHQPSATSMPIATAIMNIRYSGNVMS